MMVRNTSRRLGHGLILALAYLIGSGAYLASSTAAPDESGDRPRGKARPNAQKHNVIRTTTRPSSDQRNDGSGERRIGKGQRNFASESSGGDDDVPAQGENESGESEEEQPLEDIPEFTAEELALEITSLLNDGKIDAGITLLEQFDEFCPPPASAHDTSPVAGIHGLATQRVKRRLFERASIASGRPPIPGDSVRPAADRGQRNPFHPRLDVIDQSTRSQLSTLRDQRNAKLVRCRDLLEAGEVEAALAALDQLTDRLETIPDPHVWSTARLLRAKCLSQLGQMDAARGHIAQVCQYFHGPDAFGLQAACLPGSTIANFTEVVDYVLDEELFAQGNGFVDLHPKKMITRVEPGERARGRFLLINPSPVDACITLYADGIVRERSFSGGTWNLVWDPYLPPRHRGTMRPVCIPPFSQLTILLEAPLINDTGEQLVQISAGGHEIADWRFSTLTADEPALVSEVVDASYNEFNPFYRSPISHELYYRGSHRHITNFRVEASYPCHIEYYDADTGKLLARDVEGDGFFDNFDFDRIGFDHDYNLFPDLALDPSRPVIPIELEITPVMLIPDLEREVTLSVQVQQDGQWLETAQDVVLFP